MRSRRSSERVPPTTCGRRCRELSMSTPRRIIVKAIWNGAILAETEKTQLVEGNHYFSPEALNREYFKASLGRQVLELPTVQTTDLDAFGVRRQDGVSDAPSVMASNRQALGRPPTLVLPGSVLEVEHGVARGRVLHRNRVGYQRRPVAFCPLRGKGTRMPTRPRAVRAWHGSNRCPAPRLQRRWSAGRNRRRPRRRGHWLPRH
jgi:hypothetical protein